ncbi:MAG: YicC family protein [Bacteroidetes bacterium]|nr:YicC family protein [Bacteroidota bacterium]
MISSMTGFGKTNGVFGTKKVSVEIRSLNSKSLDLNLKFNSQYKDLESDIRRIIAEKLNRGKIDVGVYLESSGLSESGSINIELAKQYFLDIRALNEQIGNQPSDYLSLILKMPDVVHYQTPEISAEEKEWVLKLISDTCLSLINFRKQEGEAIREDLENRINAIQKDLLEIPKFESERVTTVKDRIQKGLKELGNNLLDQNRLEQEMIFYIEKMDISEEKIRLANHLDYFSETMNHSFSGKKLGFIAQEIGREINTLGSKSNHTEMQKLVVEMKDNLEKIKEQVLNIL